MLKNFFSFLWLVSFLGGLLWLLLHPGVITLEWEGHVFETTVAFGVLCVCLLLVLCFFLTKSFVFLKTFPSFYRQRKREEGLKKGYDALTRGYAALTAHDLKSARELIHLTEKNLGECPLLLHLKATVARLEKSDQKARIYLEKLSRCAGATALGAIPLIEQAQKEGNLSLALEYAEKSFEMDPSPWILERLCTLQLQAQLIPEAEKTMERLKKIRGRKAVSSYQQGVYLGQRDQALREGKEDLAFKLAKKAYELDPSHLPALMAFIREWAHRGKKEKAIDFLVKAWEKEPSSLLVDLFYDIAEGSSFADQSAWCEKLFFVAPHHPLSLQVRQGVRSRSVMATVI